MHIRICVVFLWRFWCVILLTVSVLSVEPMQRMHILFNRRDAMLSIYLLCPCVRLSQAGVLLKSVDKWSGFLARCTHHTLHCKGILAPVAALYSTRRHLSSADCLEDKREGYQNCFVAVLCTTVVHSDMRAHVSSTYRLAFVCFLPFYSCVVCFYCVRFSFFSHQPRDWLGRTSVKWPICVERDVKPWLMKGSWVSSEIRSLALEPYSKLLSLANFYLLFSQRHVDHCKCSQHSSINDRRQFIRLTGFPRLL